MKTRRYKFDTVWLQAISLLDQIGGNSELAEQQVRRYIECGDDPSDEIRNTPFECTWLLIKAQIDARKLRNERARQRRRMLKMRSYNDTKAIATVKSAITPKSASTSKTVAATAHAGRSTVDRSALNHMPENVSRHIGSKHAGNGVADGGGMQTKQPSVMGQPKPAKPRFSDRFRGPGLNR